MEVDDSQQRNVYGLLMDGVHTTRCLCQAAECRIFEIPATDEIHMKDRNHGLAWTKANNGIYNTQHSQQTYT